MWRFFISTFLFSRFSQIHFFQFPHVPVVQILFLAIFTIHYDSALHVCANCHKPLCPAPSFIFDEMPSFRLSKSSQSNESPICEILLFLLLCIIILRAFVKSWVCSANPDPLFAQLRRELGADLPDPRSPRGADVLPHQDHQGHRLPLSYRGSTKISRTNMEASSNKVINLQLSSSRLPDLFKRRKAPIN